MWVNAPTATGADLFHASASSGWCTPFLGLTAAGKPAAQVWEGVANGVAAANAITPNTWTHLAMTWSTTNGLRLYVNGVVAASNVAFNTYQASGQVDTGLLGNTSNPGCSTGLVAEVPYTGLMDSVQVYSRERTAVEVLADAQE